jgi:outer membrane protein TolC
VEKAALQEARARQARLDRLSDRDLDQLELRRLVGWAQNVPLALAGDPLASLPEAAPGDDLEVARTSDPELRGSSEALDALERAETWRSRSWLPVVDFDAQYARLVHLPGYDEFYNTFVADNWSVGVSVAFPIWNGGRTADAAARARAARERQVEQRRARDAELELLVRRSQAALGRAQARSSLARRAGAVAEEELRVVRALAEEGRAAFADVDAQEIACADAQDEVARAEAEAVSARVQVMSLRGELASGWSPSRTASTTP